MSNVNCCHSHGVYIMSKACLVGTPKSTAGAGCTVPLAPDRFWLCSGD